MAVNLSMLAGAGAQFFDNNGDPLTGGKIYTYAAGTTTPVTTYTTNAGTVAHPNPIVLDAAGRVPSGGEIWLTDGISYKFIVKTSTEATIGTYDNITNNISNVYSVLAAPGGSALVGYDDGTVQAVLDDSKPLANYTALRNYTGRATGVRITQSGIAGFFQRDASDTTSADNGGTIIVDASGRRWKRLFTGAVNVKWFGAKGDGSDDDTSAFQAAINYCLATKTTAIETLGSGFSALHAPQGIYKISAPLVVTGANGFKIYGDGRQSTQIVFVGDASHLFAYTGYICCDVQSMTLAAGSISTAGAAPAVTPQATKTNTCFKFNGTGGGTLFGMRDVQAYYWNKVFTTTDNIVNCDNHIHTTCSFLGNNYVWDNTNPQAVVWAFNDCKVFSTKNVVFNNPGISLIVRGGDFINPGTFCAGSLANTTTDLLFDGVNFENYQNIDAAAAPKFLDISGTHVITFRNCTARGGGTLVGKTSASLAGVYSIKIEKCYFTGNWAANVSSSSNGVLSHIVFEECEQTPTVVQTLSGAQGNRPLNLEYRKHPLGVQTYIDRVYNGALWSQSIGLASPTMCDSFRTEGVLNATTDSRTLPILAHDPYSLLVTGIRMSWTNNGAATVTVTVWKDSTKAVQLAQFVTASAAGTPQYFEARKGSGLSAIAEVTAASQPLYAEFTTAGNAGFIKMNLVVETVQSAL